MANYMIDYMVNKQLKNNQLKNTFNFAWPIVISDIVEAIEIFIIISMIAHLGTAQLAANCLVRQIYMVVFLFFMGPFSIVAVITAQNLGAQDESGVGLVFKQGLILAIISTVIIMPILWYAPKILLLFKQDKHVIAATIPFFHAIILATIPDTVSRVLKQFLCGFGKTRILMLIVVVTTMIKLFFCYCLLFGKLGLPQFGLAGIGYALVISSCLTVFISIIYLKKSQCTRDYKFFHKWWVVDKSCFLEILRIGMPTGLMWSVKSGFFAVIIFMMGNLGTITLAAYQVTQQFLKLPLTIVYSLAQSAAVTISKNIGNKHYAQLGSTCFMHMMLSFIAISGFCFVYLLFPELVLKLDSGLYRNNSFDIIALVLKFFPLMALYLVIQSICIIYNGLLRGLKDANFQLICNLLSSWVLAAPVAYFFGFNCGYGGGGIWWGIIVGSLGGLIALAIRFYRSYA
jgi:multidrug resistance protein, MATE family